VYMRAAALYQDEMAFSVFPSQLAFLGQ